MSLALAWGVPFDAVVDLDDGVFVTALQLLDEQAARAGGAGED